MEAKRLYKVCAKGAIGLLYTKGDALIFKISAIGEEAFKEPKHSKLLYHVCHPDMYIVVNSDRVPGVDIGTKLLLLPDLAGGGAALRVTLPTGFTDVDLKECIPITIEDEDAFFWPQGRRGNPLPILD